MERLQRLLQQLEVAKSEDTLSSTEQPSAASCGPAEHHRAAVQQARSSGCVAAACATGLHFTASAEHGFSRCHEHLGLAFVPSTPGPAEDVHGSGATTTHFFPFLTGLHGLAFTAQQTSVPTKDLKRLGGEQESGQSLRPPLQWSDGLAWASQDTLLLTLGEEEVQFELKGSHVEQMSLDEVKPIWAVRTTPTLCSWSRLSFCVAPAQLRLQPYLQSWR